MVETANTIVAEKPDFTESTKFYSPLVKNIAAEENVSVQELEAISGTGKEGRVTKKDILQYIENRKSGKKEVISTDNGAEASAAPLVKEAQKVMPVVSGEDEIIEMTRMGKMLSLIHI